MKRLSFVVLALMVAVAAVASPVTPQRARKVAETAARLCSWELQHKTTHGLDPYADCQLRDVTLAVGIADIYVFDYTIADGGREGFVVVSGDDVAAPILAFSDEGAFETNPAVRFHLEQYGRQIAAARQRGAVATPEVQHKWDAMVSGEALTEAIRHYEVDGKGDFYDDNIARLLGSMIWGQGNPYNRRCPGGSVTGCVATAFGMIMNYWDYPEHGFGQHAYNGADNPAAYGDWRWGELSADYEHTYYDWANMNDYAYINSPEPVITAISTLLYQIGVSLDMNYGLDASGCWSLPEYAIYDTSLHLSATVGTDTRIPRHFGYKYSYAGMRDSVHSDSLWLRMLYQSLADSMPVYYAGWSKDDSEDGHSGTSGHGYVIDGYFSDATDSNMFHINWGWSGSSDGYFKLDAMTPGNSDFTQWHGAVIGLQPDTSYHGYDPAAINPRQIERTMAYGQVGHIRVSGCEGKAVVVYDLMGRPVAQRSAREGKEWTLAVRQGIYVVRVGNQLGRKVVVL